MGTPYNTQAARITPTYARNRGFLSASLRSALAGYRELIAVAPSPGTVAPYYSHGQGTGLPRGRRVVQQEGFTGSHEVVVPCRPLGAEVGARGASRDWAKLVETGSTALHERFRLTYPSGAVVVAFYAGGALLEEVRVTQPLAVVDAVEDFLD